MNEYILVPEETISHSGVKGMHWGIIRWKDWQAQRRKKKTATELTKKRQAAAKKAQATRKANKEAAAKAEEERKKRTTYGEIDDAELQKRIARLQLEKTYRQLLAEQNPVQKSKAKAFVLDVLEKSGKDIATQAAAHIMGEALNSIAGSKVVNPDKMQKAK